MAVKKVKGSSARKSKAERPDAEVAAEVAQKIPKNANPDTQIQQYSCVDLLSYWGIWHLHYAVMRLDGDNLLLCHHYYSGSDSSPKMSQLSPPNRARLADVRLSETLPAVLPYGFDWEKGWLEFLKNYGEKHLKAHDPR